MVWRPSKKELERTIEKVKQDGGDASQLETLLDEYTKGQTDKVKSKISAEQPTIKDYFEMYFSLEAEGADPAQLLNLLPADIEIRPDSKIELSRHVYAIEHLGGYCPYAKTSGCPCNAVLQQGECKAKLFWKKG